MTAPAFGHVHSGLASAVFDTADAVLCTGSWAVYLDDSLARWEVYVDAVNSRSFVHSATWEQLDGPAEVAFMDDFIRAYTGTDKRELRIMSDEVYQSGARRRSMLAGTDTVASIDRVKDLQRRADAAVVAAAGVGGAPSALQLQVFAVRHAQLVEALAALEEDMARVRSAVELSSAALSRAFG